MKNYKFSIITITLNSEKFLERCLNSVKKLDQIRTEKRIKKLPLLYGVGAPTLMRNAQMDQDGELYMGMNSHKKIDTNTSENKIFKVPKLLAYDPEDNVQDIKNLKQIGRAHV